MAASATAVRDCVISVTTWCDVTEMTQEQPTMQHASSCSRLIAVSAGVSGVHPDSLIFRV